MRVHAFLLAAMVLISALTLAQNRKSTTHLSPSISMGTSNAVGSIADTSGPLVQLAELSPGSAPSSFGCSVAMSGDTIVVTNGHEVDLYVRPQTGWTNMVPTAILTPSDGAGLACGPGDGQPFVAIAQDTVVMGTPQVTIGGNQNQGAAYVFVRPAGGWTDMAETAKLTASDGAVGSLLGWSVAINPSRKAIVAGAPALGGPFGEGGPGAAYVFVKPSTAWVSMTETSKLTASDGTGINDLGEAAAINEDAIVLGAPLATTGCQFNGAWYVYPIPPAFPATMTQTAKLTACAPELSGLNAVSVAISGNTIVGGGLVPFVFVEPPGGWADMNQTASLADLSRPPWLGGSVAISGNRIVAGAFQANQDQGVVDGFLKPAGGWSGTVYNTTQFAAADGQPEADFGTSVTISGRTVVVGAPFAWGFLGSAYVFGPNP